MAEIDYQKICFDLLSDLTQRQKEILQRRFGLSSQKPQTLQKIGKFFNVTRERIRQIEDSLITNLKKSKLKQANVVFKKVENYIKNKGGVCREDELLKLAPKGFENEFNFLLYLNKNIYRSKESDLLYPFWALGCDMKVKIENIVGQMVNKLEKESRPLSENELFVPQSFKICFASLNIAKHIEKGPLGNFGLISWPEIKPRGVRGGAFLALKKQEKPMHFRDIANIIGGLPQTVHNELIRDEKFVLVGRGMYGLKEWGYEKGTVLDIIKKILHKSSKPVDKDKIVSLVLNERLVKPSTVLLNLNNKNHFQKDEQGKYKIKEA